MPWWEAFPRPKPGQKVATIHGELEGECIKIYRQDGLEWIRIRRPNGVVGEWAYTGYGWKVIDGA